MKILMVTPSYYPIIGGTESFVRQLAFKTNENGIDADVMTFNMDSKWAPLDWTETRQENGFKVFRIAGYNPKILSFHNHTLQAELLKVHVIPKPNFSKEFEDYDIVHFHDVSDLSFPFFSILNHKQVKHRLLHCHTINETYSGFKRNFLSRTILKKSAEFYLSLSTNSTNLLIDLGIDAEKIAMLPNAVDVTVFRPDLAKKVDNVVLFVARLFRSKGLHVLLKALEHVEIPVHLVVIGPVGGELAYAAQIDIKVNKINDNAFHKITRLGVVGPEELVKWYQRAAVFVCPSLTESFGIVNIEALACGTPVIATNVGGIPDIITDNTNGMLVSPNDPLVLSSAINKLLASKKLRELYGRRGREIVEKKFSWEVVLLKLEKIYSHLLDAER